MLAFLDREKRMIILCVCWSSNDSWHWQWTSIPDLVQGEHYFFKYTLNVCVLDVFLSMQCVCPGINHYISDIHRELLKQSLKKLQLEYVHFKIISLNAVKQVTKKITLLFFFLFWVVSKSVRSVWYQQHDRVCVCAYLTRKHLVCHF